MEDHRYHEKVYYCLVAVNLVTITLVTTELRYPPAVSFSYVFVPKVKVVDQFNC